MPSFDHGRKGPQKDSASRSSLPDSSARGRAPGVHPILRLQSLIGNRAVTALLRETGGLPAPGRASAAPPVVHEVLDSPGRAIDPTSRAAMESRFGEDFGGVRVHTDAKAAASAKAVDAAAYTVGQNVVFGEGLYAPGTAAGRVLLGHELAHVAQQMRGGGAGARPSRVASGGGPHEAEAHRAGMSVAAGGPASVRSAVSPGTLQRSPLTDEIDKGKSSGGKAEVFNILRAKGPIAADPDLGRCLDAAFGPNTDPAKTTDDRWLADQLVLYGPEPRWPHAALLERNRRSRDNKWAPEAGNIEASFDVGTGNPPVKAYYFPGTSDKRAMIIGGVHGTEAAGVEIVNILLERMRAPGATMPYYSVIIVPVLFPRNLARRNAAKKAGNDANATDLRKTPGFKDPQRQMPALGATPGKLDSKGKPIEAENLVLLDLVERFRPERLASSHGVTSVSSSMFDNNPRPGHEKEDAALTLKMAYATKGMTKGAQVPGNFPQGKPPRTANKELSKNADPGVSFGEYGSQDAGARPAMNVITVEPGGNQTSAEAKDPKARRIELESFAVVLRDIFLGPP